MCVVTGGNKLALAPTSPAPSHLAVLDGLAEEVVQQQVLQPSVPVERLLDLPQEHTKGPTQDNQALKWQSFTKKRFKNGGGGGASLTVFVWTTMA